MTTELDLEVGDPARADAEAERATRKQRASRVSANKSTTKRSSTTTRGKQVEAELANRLDRTFDRISEALDARGDDELATIVQEDKQAMCAGLVSLTRSVKPLRNPLLMFLNLVEPVLAFGRVGRVLVMRVMARRARQLAEWEAAQAEQAGSPA